MPYYNYEARDKNGKFIKNQVFAVNKQEIIELLHKEDLLILSVKEATEVEEKYARKLHKGIRLKDLSVFAKELAILLENGIPLIDAIDIIVKQVESATLIKIIKEIRKDLEGGLSFRDAIAKHPRVFGGFWQDMAEAGELSGQLPFVMRQIVDFLESREVARKKIINAFIYPCLLLALAVATVFIFVFKVVPIFEELFSAFDAELPVFTRIIIGISYVLRHYFIIFFIGAVILIFVLKRFLATPAGKRIYENAIFHTPLIGAFMMALSIERFASTLSILVKSGIPIIKALEVSLKTSQQLVFAERISDAKTKVTTGVPLSEALHQTGFFPPLAVQLVLVAEKTGNYSGMLEEVAKYYRDIVDTFITRFTALLEPAVLVFMAIIVGSLVIAMFLPIFSLAGLA